MFSLFGLSWFRLVWSGNWFLVHQSFLHWQIYVADVTSPWSAKLPGPNIPTNSHWLPKQWSSLYPSNSKPHFGISGYTVRPIAANNSDQFLLIAKRMIVIIVVLLFSTYIYYIYAYACFWFICLVFYWPTLVVTHTHWLSLRLVMFVWLFISSSFHFILLYSTLLGFFIILSNILQMGWEPPICNISQESSISPSILILLHLSDTYTSQLRPSKLPHIFVFTVLGWFQYKWQFKASSLKYQANF